MIGNTVESLRLKRKRVLQRLKIRHCGPIPTERKDDKCQNLSITMGNHRSLNFRLSDIGKKHEYLKRHHKTCRYLPWNICREYGMDGLPKEWYDHVPTPVTTVSSCTVLYNQQIHHTDRTVPDNKPDIILRSIMRCKLIEVVEAG